MKSQNENARRGKRRSREVVQRLVDEFEVSETEVFIRRRLLALCRRRPVTLVQATVT